MKSMSIAASGELVSRLSTHRRVVALEDTDFTDVAAVVITAADSRSGILALLKRTGFHLPVFLYSEDAVELPAGVRLSSTAMSSSGWSWNPQPVSMKRICCRHFMTR